jgi:hypothetical protein
MTNQEETSLQIALHILNIVDSILDLARSLRSRVSRQVIRGHIRRTLDLLNPILQQCMDTGLLDRPQAESIAKLTALEFAHLLGPEEEQQLPL